MPIIKCVNINENSSWAIWRIDEAYQDLLNYSTLNSEDWELLDSIHHPQKKLEWLSSRLTVRHLVKNRNLVFNGIGKDEFNKPFLKNHECEISLSHSFPYSCAIIHGFNAVGIDIEHPRPKLLTIAKKFLNNNELQFANSELNKLSILWSAKEALYKIHGRQKLTFRDHLEIAPFDIHSNTNFEGKIKLEGQSEEIYLLSFLPIHNHFVVFNI